MKNNMIKLVCMMVVLALVAGLLAGCKTEPTNSANDRETSESGETKNTVNPDISEPNQSIASGALIPDQTSESTTETTASSGNTYTLYGKTFTLSVHLEDYFYEMEGSDYKYFNLEEFMGHYGLVDKTGEERIYNRNAYGDGTLVVEFDTLNFVQHSEESGNGVCRYIGLHFPYSFGSIATIKGGTGGIDTTGGIFEVNGALSSKGRPYSKWCLTYSEIVVLAVLLDTYQQTGDTIAVVDDLKEIFDFVSDGDQRGVVV